MDCLRTMKPSLNFIKLPQSVPKNLPNGPFSNREMPAVIKDVSVEAALNSAERTIF